MLTWSTEYDINSGKFIIQKSTDGTKWAEIGEVTSGGNSSVKKRYQYQDDQPLEKNFYRLKELDTDGNFQFSKVVFIEKSGSINNDFLIYPNPARGDTKILLKEPGSKIQRLQLNNALGQAVKLFMIPAGANFINLHLNDLKKGTYLLKLSEAEGKYQTLIIQ